MVNFIHGVFFGPPAPSNPWEAATWNGPFRARAALQLQGDPTVYRGPHEYSSPEAAPADWIGQNIPPAGGRAKH